MKTVVSRIYEDGYNRVDYMLNIDKRIIALIITERYTNKGKDVVSSCIITPSDDPVSVLKRVDSTPFLTAVQLGFNDDVIFHWLKQELISYDCK